MTVSNSTNNFNLNLIDFASSPWHTDEHSNWIVVDTLMNTILTMSSFQGDWLNSTAYVIDQTVVDIDLGFIYICLVDHTSIISPNTFATDRAANPTYWEQAVFISTAIGDAADSAIASAASAVDSANSASEAATSAALMPPTLASSTALDLLRVNAGKTAYEFVSILDEDDMVSNSSTLLSSQQAIKAYVDNAEPFIAGTVMIFYQAAAPTGWTKSVTNNDKALRVVSGTGGGTGGTHDLSSPPSTAHSHTQPTHAHTQPTHSHTTSGHVHTTTGHALSIAEMPSHTHDVDSSGGGATLAIGASSAGVSGGATGSAGSGNSHTHGDTGSGGGAGTGNAGDESTGSAGNESTSSESPTAFSPTYVDVLVCSKD